MASQAFQIQASEKYMREVHGHHVLSSLLNWQEFILGFFFLVAGVVVYLVSRPMDSVNFLIQHEQIQLFFHQFPDIYGKIGGVAPSFFHALAFCLMSAALVCRRKTKIFLCFAWLSIETVFELGQLLTPSFLYHLPSTISSLPVVDTLLAYFVGGRFDPYDLLAIMCGITAALLLIMWRHGRG